jgi:hypothetical protein
MTWFRDWGRKHYLKGGKYFPFSVIAHLGERFYIIYYKIGVISVLVCAIVIFILALIMM